MGCLLALVIVKTPYMPQPLATNSAALRLKGTLSLDTELGRFLGEPRIRLLEAIGQLGSISQAAKRVPLSYKAAWESVEAINNLAAMPVVERVVGGRAGGGARLTPYGIQLVALYRAMEEASQRMLARLTAAMGEGSAVDLKQFQTLLRSMSMKISARNQYVGPVTALREGAVNFEVRMRLDGENSLVANITKESAEVLGLGIGTEVMALVKASSVLLMTDEGARTSARNHLWGEVCAIHQGAVNSEVTLALPSGKTVTAIVSVPSAYKAKFHCSLVATISRPEA